MCVYTHPYTHAMHDLYAHLTIRYIHYNAHTHITAYKYDAMCNSEARKFERKCRFFYIFSQIFGKCSPLCHEINHQKSCSSC